MTIGNAIVATVARYLRGARWLRIAFAPLSIVVVGLNGCASAPGGEESLDLVCNSAQQCRVRVEVSCTQGGCRAAVDHPRVFARGNDVVWFVENNPGQ